MPKLVYSIPFFHRRDSIEYTTSWGLRCLRRILLASVTLRKWPSLGFRLFCTGVSDLVRVLPEGPCFVQARIAQNVVDCSYTSSSGCLHGLLHTALKLTNVRSSSSLLKSIPETALIYRRLTISQAPVEKSSQKKYVILTSWASVATALLLMLLVGGAFYVADLKSRECTVSVWAHSNACFR